MSRARFHVATVDIGVCAVLLDNEDVAAQAQNRIKRDDIEFGEARDVKFDHGGHLT